MKPEIIQSDIQEESLFGCIMYGTHINRDIDK